MAETITFEDALKRLEKIVSELESGKLTLEEAVKRYEEGIKLSLICSKTLETAKRKVEILLKKNISSNEPPQNEVGQARFETKEFEEVPSDEDTK